MTLCFLSSLLLLGLLRQKHRVDVGENTTRGDGDTTEKLVELLVVPHRQLNVTGDDASLLVITGRVAGELQNLSREILEDRSQINWSTSSNTAGILALLQKPMNTPDRELKPCLLGSRNGLAALGLATTCCTFSCFS